MRELGQDGGGAEGDRTPDLLIANEALSQLSYSPAHAMLGQIGLPRRREHAEQPW
jgi:hypothetical protein